MSIQDTFWQQFGPVLFGQPREPQTDQEWVAAGKQLRGLVQLDQLATRLEQAATQPAQRPQARKQHDLAGSVYYDGEGRACCPQHEKPLKEGKFGYFCSAKDPQGKNGYCTFTIKHL
jgi:hypothetical protein